VRKSIIVLFVLTVAVMFASMTATAQTGIALSTSSTSGVSFTGTGSGNLSMVTGVSGTAAGLGALLGTTGYYVVTGPVMLTLGTHFTTPLDFADYTGSGTLDFSIGSTPGGTNLLDGTLSLLDLVQVSSTGMTNVGKVTDITITGGSLAGDFPGATGISQLTLNLGGLFLPSLGMGSTAAEKLGGATLDALTTPEPRSMLLFGSGLVLFGMILRRRYQESRS
jgi:hypothetical protein